jgi:hypothetical protein
MHRGSGGNQPAYQSMINHCSAWPLLGRTGDTIVKRAQATRHPVTI